MSVKAYPVIYSRTKNVDFVPDFLARPADLNYREANKFVSFAMGDLNANSGKRYAVFSVGNYCITGIACLTNEIAGTGSEEYTKDTFGRATVAFIGIAVDKSSCNGDIPQLSDEKYWEIYLKYLKKQWDAPVTHSEKCTKPEIELETTCCSSSKPETKSLRGKNIIAKSYYDGMSQEIFNYYLAENLGSSSSCSFITREIGDLTVFSKSAFNCIVVNDSLIKKLEEEQIKNPPPISPTPLSGEGDDDKKGQPQNSKYAKTEKNLGSTIMIILLLIVIVVCLVIKCNHSDNKHTEKFSVKNSVDKEGAGYGKQDIRNT